MTKVNVIFFTKLLLNKKNKLENFKNYLDFSQHAWVSINMLLTHVCSICGRELMHFCKISSNKIYIWKSIYSLDSGWSYLSIYSLSHFISNEEAVKRQRVPPTNDRICNWHVTESNGIKRSMLASSTWIMSTAVNLHSWSTSNMCSNTHSCSLLWTKCMQNSFNIIFQQNKRHNQQVGI